MRHVTPFDMARTGFEMTQLGVEAGAVVWMRVMGMSGAWNTPFDESYRMWREKPGAFTEAMGRGMEAAMKGHAPDVVMSASIAPLHRDASENRARLAERGARKVA